MVTDNSTTVRTELTEKTAVHTIQTVNRQETLLGSESVVVVGASSFIGSHLSVSLNSVGYKVLPLEDNVVYNVFDSMIWYRWNQLIHNKFDPMFIDFSDSSKLKSVIEGRNPQVILFIPTLIFDDGEISQDHMSNISLISTHLKHFVQILDYIKESRPQTHVILLSVSQTSIPSRQKAWMKTFEMSLSLYQDSFRASTVRIDQVYGPWKYGNNKESDSSWYIEDIVQTVKDVIHEKEQCVDIDFNCNECKFACAAIIPEKTVSFSKGMELTRNWMNEYLTLEARDVVMTTYFTGVKNPMHSVDYSANKFRFMRTWFLSARKHGLHMIIFHDQLSGDFQARIKEFYPRVEFVKSSTSGASPNDKRFQLFYDYILSHQDIRNVLMTDIRDIELGHNPFDVMKVLGDYIYPGVDLPFQASTSSYGFVLDKVKNCYGAGEGQSEAMKLYTLMNAGVLGGSRHAVLVTLSLINQYLKKSRSSLNCNMPALAIVLHRYFLEKMFFGYPWNNAFAVEYAGSPGVAVMHKSGHLIYP